MSLGFNSPTNSNDSLSFSLDSSEAGTISISSSTHSLSLTNTNVIQGSNTFTFDELQDEVHMMI